LEEDNKNIAKVKSASNDRAPTLEEIRKLVEYPDRRIKPIVYTMCASGIRVGAWGYLRWKHVTPIKNDKDEIIAAKLTVYPGEPEQYYTFITPEAYNSLRDWMDFRASYGGCSFYQSN
jgi:integrase